MGRLGESVDLIGYFVLLVAVVGSMWCALYICVHFRSLKILIVILPTNKLKF